MFLLFLENANEKEKREFMEEIMLMKEVGKHQNVLSFLGCWTTTKPLYLIIEYIAHGDLLHWLRGKRSQVSITNCAECLYCIPISFGFEI